MTAQNSGLEMFSKTVFRHWPNFRLWAASSSMRIASGLSYTATSKNVIMLYLLHLYIHARAFAFHCSSWPSQKVK